MTGSIRLFYALALATLIAFVLYSGRTIFVPVVVAGFLGFLIFTLKEAIRRGPLVGRYLPNWLCYVFAFALLISGFVLFIEIIRGNLEDILRSAPNYETRLRTLTQSGIQQLRDAGVLPEEIVGGVDQLRAEAVAMINPLLTQIGGGARSITGSSVTIFLYTAFMLLERGRTFKKINLLNADSDRRAAVNETIADIASQARQYITVKTVANLIVAAISFFIMSAIGVDFAGFWALLIFAFNFIPIVGAISAISLPVILLMVQPDGGGVQKALILLALLVGAEQTMSSVIEPRIIGKSLNLSPLVILLSLAVWGALWGFAGMLLAVPMTVTVMIILTQFEPTRPLAILLSDSGQIAPIKHAPLSRGPTLNNA